MTIDFEIFEKFVKFNRRKSKNKWKDEKIIHEYIKNWNIRNFSFNVAFLFVDIILIYNDVNTKF